MLLQQLHRDYKGVTIDAEVLIVKTYSLLKPNLAVHIYTVSVMLNISLIPKKFYLAERFV